MQSVKYTTAFLALCCCLSYAVALDQCLSGTWAKRVINLSVNQEISVTPKLAMIPSSAMVNGNADSQFDIVYVTGTEIYFSRGALDYEVAKKINLSANIPVAENSDISLVAANINDDNIVDLVVSTFGFNTFGEATILPNSPVQDDEDDVIVQQRFPVRTISWLKKINPVGTNWASYIISKRVGFTSWTLTATGKINDDTNEDVVALDAAIGGVGDSQPASDNNGARLFLTWYRNTGTVESNTPWPRIEIASDLPPSRQPASGLCLLDVDGDGSTDVVAAIGNQVWFFKNVQGDGQQWVTEVDPFGVTSGVSALQLSVSSLSCDSVSIGPNPTIEVTYSLGQSGSEETTSFVAAYVSDNGVWSPMGPPLIGGLTQPATGLLAADLDEDGSIDLVWREGVSKRRPLDGFVEGQTCPFVTGACTETVSEGDRLVWLRDSDANEGSFSPEVHVLSNLTDLAGTTLQAQDADGDGDKDILFYSQLGGYLAYLENPLNECGNGNGADTTAPIIQLLGPVSAYDNLVPQCSVYVEPGFSVTDNQDSGQMLSGLVEMSGDFPVVTSVPGVYSVVYDVEDFNGNQAQSQTRYLTVVEGNSECVGDNTKPSIKILGGKTFAKNKVQQCGQYNEEGMTVQDNGPDNLNNLVDAVIRTGYVDSSVPGKYTLYYDVTDSNGNSATTIKRKVRVLENPNANC